MAHTKAGGSTRLGRESESKRLGVKLFDGQPAQPGSILIRQRGTKFYPGKNVRRGGDDTLYAVKSGLVKFATKTHKSFDGSRRLVKVVNVIEKQWSDKKTAISTNPALFHGRGSFSTITLIFASRPWPNSTVTSCSPSVLIGLNSLIWLFCALCPFLFSVSAIFCALIEPKI